MNTWNTIDTNQLAMVPRALQQLELLSQYKCQLILTFLKLNGSATKKMIIHQTQVDPIQADKILKQLSKFQVVDKSRYKGRTLYIYNPYRMKQISKICKALAAFWN